MKLILKIGLIICGLLFVLLIVKGCYETKKAKEQFSNIGMINKESLSDLDEDTMKNAWLFDSEHDEMDDCYNYWYTICSDNVVDFDIPYEGGSHLYITILNMKQTGYEVSLKIVKGQIGGHESDATNYARVRFDRGKIEEYAYEESNDGSSDVVYLMFPEGFIEKCKQAKDILLELPFYEEGTRQFKFHVDKPLPKNLK